MTIGIAATCIYKTKPGIVLCCDWQGTSTFTKGDHLHKMRNSRLSSSILAGDLSDATSLLTECSTAVSAFERCKRTDTDIGLNTYMAALRKIVQEKRLALVDHELKMTLGMSAEEFWKNGKQALLDSEHLTAVNEIRKVDLGVALILATLCPEWEEPFLVTIDSTGKVACEDTFCTIGTGGLIANGVLSKFEWDATPPSLEECVYRVLFAKAFSESDPSVGEAMSLEVRLPDGVHELTSGAFEKFNKNVFKALQLPKLEIDEKNFLQKMEL